MGIQDLPAVNASLNALAAVFLTAGYLFIRTGRRRAHKRCMLTALATSTLFLACYLVYHYNVGSKPYEGQGLLRQLYLTILVTHVVLAASVVPLALVTANRGLRDRLDAHVRIARWTLPIWLYVSVTGVVIYLMLYW
jgi:uncharacterized membrane protein YozB (DUF420 family)